MSKIKTLATGLLGLAGTEASAEIAVKTTEALTSDPTQNIVTVADLLVKIAVAFVTIWHIIKKPKPVKE